MGFCERPHCHFKHRKVEPNLHTADVIKVKQNLHTADVIKVKPNLHTSDDVEVACKSEYIEEDTKEDVKRIKPDPDGESKPINLDLACPSDANKSNIDSSVPDASNLQHLVEEAVRKVLLGAGGISLDPAKILGSLDTSSVLAKIKEERQDSDDDVCIIEDTQTAPAPPISPSKPKLYLPPEDSPAYKPTPIKQLEKREKSTSNLSPSLIQASQLSSSRSSIVARQRPS